jgi:hypothetical protein
VPERPDTQPGQPREPPDRQQEVIHARIVDPRVGRESSAGRDALDREFPARRGRARALVETRHGQSARITTGIGI